MRARPNAFHSAVPAVHGRDALSGAVNFDSEGLRSPGDAPVRGLFAAGPRPLRAPHDDFDQPNHP